MDEQTKKNYINLRYNLRIIRNKINCINDRRDELVDALKSCLQINNLTIGRDEAVNVADNVNNIRYEINNDLLQVINYKINS